MRGNLYSSLGTRLVNHTQFPTLEEPEGMILALKGDCAHWIQVQVKFSGQDESAFQKALWSREQYVLLERMCPFCRIKRWFQFSFPVFLLQTNQPSAPIDWSFEPYTPLKLSDPLEQFEAPPDLAARWYSEAMEHKKQGELDQAEIKFRDCITLCDNLRMSGEHQTASLALSSLLSETGRTDEAAQVRAWADLVPNY